MNRKIILPIFALALAVMACQLQTATSTPASPTITPATDTALPPVPTDTPAPPTPSGLTLEMLRNGTYFAPFYSRTVKLVNGAYTEGSGTTLYTVQMLDTVAFGDLNGDGVNDAAFLLAESGGGSGVFESLVTVLDVGGAPDQAWQVQLGDRVRINSLAIDSGTIRLDGLVQGPNDPMCCPSQPETQSFRLMGNTLWLTRLTSRTPDNHDRSISINTPADGSSVTNPFTVSGSVTIAPFENTLAYQLFLPDGTKVNESTLLVDSGGNAGGPGTFSQPFNLSNAGIRGPVILQILDRSAADGSTLALDSIMLIVH
ncbi:MAG: Gmad2 immunoglobulin-like domain-containing protein [Anaerolineales bacterium]|jgi:hypothetical protein